MRSPREIGVLCASGLALTVGCGGGSSSGGFCFGCPAGADDGPLFTLVVSDGNATGAQQAPLAGAFVALDRGDGSRVEGTTGGDGSVTLPVDLSKGPFAFTVAYPGYVAVTDLGLTETGTWMLTLEPLDENSTYADVSGVVTGMKDDNDTIVVSTSVPSTRFWGLGPEYAIRVTRSQPFSVVLAELTSGPATSNPPELGTVFLQWAEFDGPASNNAVSLDLTFPTTITGTTHGGRSLMPMMAGGVFRLPPHLANAQGYLNVTTAHSTTFLGSTTSVSSTSGDMLEFTAEYVLPVDLAPDVETTAWVTDGSAYSYAISQGAPVSEYDFIDPPSLRSPLPLYGDLPVTNFQTATGTGGSAGLSVDILRDDGDVIWRVFDEPLLPVMMKLPKLPSAIDPRIVLGTGTVSAMPVVCNAGSGGKCSQWAVGAPATLESP